MLSYSGRRLMASEYRACASNLCIKPMQRHIFPLKNYIDAAILTFISHYFGLYMGVNKSKQTHQANNGDMANNTHTHNNPTWPHVEEASYLQSCSFPSSLGLGGCSEQNEK
jgi:hypothetical protein